MSTNVDPTPGARLPGWLALWPYALVLAVGAFVLLPHLGDYGFWDPWEPKYAQSAREMVERDSYVVPYYLDNVRLTKPILVYWGILAGASVFGLNEFGARIVGVCLALATMAGVFYAVSRLRGRQAGLISALVLGTVPQFYLIARQAMPDVYLFTTAGLCLLFFCLGLLGPEKRRDVHFGVSYACMALAVLAKGPVIIGTVFLATLAIYTVIQIDLRELWQRGRRSETLRFVATAVPAAAALASLAFTAYLFGTSRAWWGFTEGGRGDMADARERIQSACARFHLAEILLVLVAAGAALLAVRMVRRARTAPGWAALPALAALAALGGLFAGDLPFKILVTAVLGAMACLILAAHASWRFLHQDWLWPVIQPLVRPIRKQLLLFLVVFIVVAGPWHLAVFIEEGHGYMTDFIIKHNIHRAGEVVNRSGNSDYYLGVLTFGLFPWSCFLPIAIASLVGWWHRGPLRKHGLEVFLLISVAVMFAAFTVSATKFSHYLAPILVPVCVLIGLAIARTLEERHSVASRLAWIVAAMLFLLPALDIVHEDGFSHLVGAFTVKTWVPDQLSAGPYFKGIVAFAGACLFASILVRSRVLLAGLVAAAALMANFATATLIPNLSKHKTMKRLCETWKSEAPDGDVPICLFGDMKHGVTFYTERQIEFTLTRDAFLEFVDPARPAYCIVERKALAAVRQDHRSRHRGAELIVVDDSHVGFALVRNFRPGFSRRGS